MNVLVSLMLARQPVLFWGFFVCLFSDFVVNSGMPRFIYCCEHCSENENKIFFFFWGGGGIGGIKVLAMIVLLFWKNEQIEGLSEIQT